MKTAINRGIDEIDKRIESYSNIRAENSVSEIAKENYLQALGEAKTILTMLLDKERTQIINACNAGLSGIPRLAATYYLETFEK